MTARIGMTDIIADLRGITEAGTADWTAGTVAYFSDDMLQSILDRYKEPFVYKGMEAEQPIRTSTGWLWSLYEIEDTQHIEESTGGTAVFYIQDNIGGTLAANAYSMDYRNGLMTLITPVAIATPYFATGYSYDINAAAADVWQTKANHASASFDFSTDNHTVNRSKVFENYQKMANYYRSLSKEGAGGSLEMTRKDTEQC